MFFRLFRSIWIALFCLVSFLSVSDFVARFLMNHPLHFINLRKLRTSARHCGHSTSGTTSASIASTPFSVKRIPINLSWIMRRSHFSLFTIKPFYLSLTSTLYSQRSCSSTVSAKMFMPAVIDATLKRLLYCVLINLRCGCYSERRSLVQK